MAPPHQPPSSHLTIITDSQIPLSVRYAQPKSFSTLLLPPLVHRTLHNALDNDPPSILVSKNGLVIPHPETLDKQDIPSASAETDHELTVKLHLVGESSSEQQIAWVNEAMEFLCRTKGLSGVDTLLVGWKGVDYKGKKTIPRDANEQSKAALGRSISPEDEARIVETWRMLSKQLSPTHGKNRIRRLGTLYMPMGLLKSLSSTGSTPAINVMDTPDCHHLPFEYTDFARTSGIDLWAGGGREGADPLPSAELHNLLQEFSAKITATDNRRFLNIIPVNESQSGYDHSSSMDIDIRWVLGYTLLSKTRNVVEDKGYIVSAAMQ